MLRNLFQRRRDTPIQVPEEVYQNLLHEWIEGNMARYMDVQRHSLAVEAVLHSIECGPTVDLCNCRDPELMRDYLANNLRKVY